MAKWKPESKNEDDLCTHYRLNAWCVHLKDHEGQHHYEGEEKAS